MEQSEKIVFFRAKADLVIGLARDEKSRATFTALFSWIDGCKSQPKLPAEYFRRADQLLEEIVAALRPEPREQIERELRRRFGLTRLGKPPKKIGTVIKKTLKIGKIETDDDARLIKEFVDNTTNIEAVGLKTYYKLAGMIDHYKHIEN